MAESRASLFAVIFVLLSFPAASFAAPIGTIAAPSTEKVTRGNFAYARMFALVPEEEQMVAKRGGQSVADGEEQSPFALQAGRFARNVPGERAGTENFAFAFARRDGRFAKRSGGRPFAVELIEVLPVEQFAKRGKFA